MKNARLPNTIIAIYYFALAVTLEVLLICRVIEHPNWYLGLVLALSSFPEIVLYFLDHEYRHKICAGTILLAVISTVCGILFSFLPNVNPETICIFWGILDILRGVNQVFLSSLEVKNHKLAFAKMAINILTIVVGILLCIHLKNGIRFHLIMLGVSIILLGAYEIVQTIVYKRGVRSEN